MSLEAKDGEAETQAENLPARREAPKVEHGEDGEWEAPPRMEWRVFGPEAEPAGPAPAPRRDWRRIAAAASLASVVAIGGAAAAVHFRQSARAEVAESRAVAHRLDALAAKLESLEANRARDDQASQRKLIAEIKASAANARDTGGTTAQFVARIDRLEKEQSARLDRMDRDAAARVAELTSRLDKMEARAPTPAPVAVAPAPAPKPPVKPEVTKAEPSVSNETTGSIEKPKPRLRGFYLSEIRNGFAMIDGPSGEMTVAPGDLVPGGGRVLRIERHGREWVVVTTTGQIAAADD